MKREKEVRDEGPITHRKTGQTGKPNLPPITEYRPKPDVLYYDAKTNKKVRKKEIQPASLPRQLPPPLPPPAKPRTTNRKDNPSKSRPAVSNGERTSRPRVPKRESSKSVPPMKMDDGQRQIGKQRKLGKIPARRCRSQPIKHTETRQNSKKTAWKEDGQCKPRRRGDEERESDGMSKRQVLAGPRLLTARTKLNAAASASSTSDPFSVVEAQSKELVQRSAKEVEKLKVKKIVDYVYTMDCAYGSIASKFTRISLNETGDDLDGPRRRSVRGSSRLSTASHVTYRGLTAILSGRASAMSDYVALPKTPKLVYGSLVSLRR